MFKDYIPQILLFAAFVLTLAAYVILRLDGVEGGPVDEGLLILMGALAGVTPAVARRTN